MTYLSDKTYWKIGGKCQNFHEVNSIDEISNILKEYNITTNELIVIGNGTNILFDSNGFDGHILKLSKGFNFVNYLGDGNIEVGANAWVPGLVRKLSVMGLGGIEHCVGIPATFGGLVAMNGGSQRKSISENLIQVKYIDVDGEVKVLFTSANEFSYRTSPFKNTGKIILSAIINCNVIAPRSNRASLISILRERRRKFPRKIPNCGSVFLSSPEIYRKIGPPGYVIESLGLKGKKVGGAQISPVHANFIVNNGNATSDDILSLVKIINNHCWEKYHFRMEAEAIYYPREGKPCSLSEIE